MTGCVCDLAGWCERHKVNKNDHLVKLCKTKQNYWDAWERGSGPKQEIDVGRRIASAMPKARVGSRLKQRIADLGYVAEQGCGCNSLAANMDRWGIDGCRKRIDEIVDHLEEQAKKAGTLERMAVTLPLVKTQARRFLVDLVTEVINLEVERELLSLRSVDDNANMDDQSRQDKHHISE